MFALNRLSLLLTTVFLAHPTLAIDFVNGQKYILTSNLTGNASFLQCGSDSKCSMFPIAGAQESDAISFNWLGGSPNVNTTVQLLLTDGTRALDINSNGLSSNGDSIFANSDIDTVKLNGQMWELITAPLDGTFYIYNPAQKVVLDVNSDKVTPFVNSVVNGIANPGQEWTFNALLQTATVTAPSVQSVTVTGASSSTVTVTTTVGCAQKRYIPVRRQSIYDTSTTTIIASSTTTIFVATSTGIVTVTATATFCPSQAASTSLSAGAKAGIGIGVVGVVLLACVVGLLICCMRRRYQPMRPTSEEALGTRSPMEVSSSAGTYSDVVPIHEMRGNMSGNEGRAELAGERVQGT